MNKVIHYLAHYFLPHHTNNHRPRIFHPDILFILIGLVFFLEIGLRVTAKTYPDILGYATNITIEDLVRFTNQERVSHGLPPVVFNQQLAKAAEEKAHDMFSDNYWAHVAPDGTTPWDFILKQNYKYAYAGENLARDFSDSKGVITAWMNSPSHRENILRKEYQEVGFAVVNGVLEGEETTLVVQMFGTPQAKKPSVSVASSNTTAPPDVAIGKMENENTQITSVSVKKPLFNMKSIQNTLSLVLLGGFVVLFLVDGAIVFLHKTVRVAGHNIAHILFIGAIIGIIILSGRGYILSIMQ